MGECHCKQIDCETTLHKDLDLEAVNINFVLQYKELKVAKLIRKWN